MAKFWLVAGGAGFADPHLCAPLLVNQGHPAEIQRRSPRTPAEEELARTICYDDKLLSRPAGADKLAWRGA